MARQTRLDWFASRARRQAVRRGGAGSRRWSHRRSLRFEPLEDRRLLTIMVNTLVDENDGVEVGGVSLRDAIAAAAPNDNIAFSVTGTITLEHGELVVDKDLSIVGPGADVLSIDAGGASRVFNIDDGSGALATVSISGLTISGGYIAGDGGGVSNAENLTIVASTISGNTSTHSGGAVFTHQGSLTIRDSTLSGNTAQYGGGLYVVSGLAFTTTITNSTVSGNTATDGGGGLYNFVGHLVIEHTTISDNTADHQRGGGLVSWGDDNTTLTEVYSSIIAGNHANDELLPGTDVDVVGGEVGGPDNTIVSSGHNIVDTGNALASFNLDGDAILPILDLLLGPLADNGGPTKTHALLYGSPAIDAGDPAAEAGVDTVPEFDQRGTPFGRVFDGDNDSLSVIDVGAFESDLVLFVVDTLTDESDGDFSTGDFSLREAIEQAAVLVAGSPKIVFDSALFTGGPESISLDFALGQLEITAKMVVEGPGADLLTIVAAPFRRIFVVDDLDNLTQSDVAIRALTLTGGNDPNGGGAILTRERLEVADSLITGNTAQWGGGIYNDLYGELTVVNCQVSGNDATSSGAGIYNWGGTAFIFDSVISGNDSANGGGGIKNVNNGAMSISRSTISGNTAQTTGGGLYNGDGNVLVADSTVSGNTADSGGGIYVVTPTNDTTTISNSTISSNVAPLGGAGIFTKSGHTVIQFSTVTENNSNDFAGSGVVTWGDAAFALTEIRSTIVAGNHHTDVAVTGGFVDTFASLGYNVIGTGSLGNFAADGDLTGVTDPMLGPLADNGGPTLTHALLPGSPAIDAGDPGAVAGLDGVPEFDQRGSGFNRVRDGDAAEDIAIDVGAFEVQQFVVGPALPGDYNLDEMVDAADYTVWRDTLGQEVDFFDGADGDGDGTIDDGDYDVWKLNFGNSLVGGGSVAESLSSTEPLSFAAAASLDGSIVVTTLEQIAPAPAVPVLSYVTQRPALPWVGRAAADHTTISAPTKLNREDSDALIAWLTTQPRSTAASDDAFERDADRTAANDADADPIEAALDTAFAAFRL